MQLTLRKYRLASRIIPILLLAFVATFAYANNDNRLNNIKTIVVFGDSLSDTGNAARLSDEMHLGFRFPGPAVNYTDGRFTDGIDTTPYARKYFGVWVEQFAASLPSRPEVRNSLDGGTDYAYGYATSGDGTSPAVGPLVVNNIGQQITDYLATNPKIDDSVLFVVWGGANDFLHATPASLTPAFVQNVALNMTVDIQRLIEAGGAQFIVANLPPLGLTPYMLHSDAATNLSAGFNFALAQGISYLRGTYCQRDLTIFQLDVFSLIQQIVDSPTRFSLMNVDSPAQYPTNPDSSANPDSYLFWDDVHPTTRGHSILADAAKHLVSEHNCNASGESCVYPVPQQCNGNHCAIPVN